MLPQLQAALTTAALEGGSNIITVAPGTYHITNSINRFVYHAENGGGSLHIVAENFNALSIFDDHLYKPGYQVRYGFTQSFIMFHQG